MTGAHRIRVLRTTASTNDDAKKAAEAGEPEGLVIRALQQTAGRGREGRPWESPEGNLYCSILLRPEGGLSSYGQHSFVVALALFGTLKPLLPAVAMTLKWPNDVLIGGKKIAGILLESGPGWLVAGVGLNILHHPERALYPTTSLKAAGSALLNPEAVLERFLTQLTYWCGVIREAGFGPVRSVWLENAQKGPLAVRLPNGILEGEFLDIDEDGRLRLGLADGSERVIATGDIFFGGQT
ncbi:MAG: biotin--[acetyl-CoA-carboxylase] ligase [Pseudomonadota bacterium]|nr:biotin--[acetyl-CoA-carboxylase] ligase [Pseudomonadota bacterium]